MQDRMQDRPAAPAATPAAEMPWLSGLDDAKAFDGLHRPWWRWLLPEPAPLMRTWRQRAKMRRALAQIDAHTLRDAGIDPGAAHFEASLPFWRAPIRLRDSSAD
ncbi:DUF1127 domain-containing protein [Ferrovibrio sp.]|uniref:DUF1127 domain-containing protein n=1 Tax=Ferrovibrio sp. TaxID=1917215 RepID=UPI002ED14E1E